IQLQKFNRFEVFPKALTQLSSPVNMAIPFRGRFPATVLFPELCFELSGERHVRRCVNRSLPELRRFEVDCMTWYGGTKVKTVISRRMDGSFRIGLKARRGLIPRACAV